MRADAFLFGGHSVLDPPLPIPNRDVKRDSADDSVDYPCESRSPPDTLPVPSASQKKHQKSTVPTDRAFLARISVLFVVLQELLAFGHAGSILAIILL